MKQTNNRRLDSPPREDEPRGFSELELATGKVPLRPIHRIGLLLLYGIPLLGVIFIGAGAISILKDAPTVGRCLLVPLILLWGLLGLAMGRIVWGVLTSPSQRDYEPPASTPEVPPRCANGSRSQSESDIALNRNILHIKRKRPKSGPHC